jgi:hypothetical protein
MVVTAQHVIEALAGEFDVRAYSGRGMYGQQCVGVDTEGVGDLMKIAVLLVRHGIDPFDVAGLGDALHTDSMGRGVILYWPSLKLTPEQVAAFADAEDAEEEEEERAFAAEMRWRTAR